MGGLFLTVNQKEWDMKQHWPISRYYWEFTWGFKNTIKTES